MIEFTLNRNRNGKKSRGTKKYPRKRIFMKAEVVAKFAVWFVIFIILITLGLEMISAPNTIENVIGFFMVVAALYLSVRTKCLTAIKLERKHEK
jgi:fumarate reductase subunit C